MQNLAEKIEELPIELQKEVEDFVEFLQTKKMKRSKKKLTPPKFDWVGGLKDLKDQYTSVELQHKATEWMIEGALKK